MRKSEFLISYSFLISELIEYYNAGGLETNEEIELSVLLRDQEAFKAEVALLRYWPFVLIFFAFRWRDLFNLSKS